MHVLSVIATFCYMQPDNHCEVLTTFCILVNIIVQIFCKQCSMSVAVSHISLTYICCLNEHIEPARLLLSSAYSLWLV